MPSLKKKAIRQRDMIMLQAKLQPDAYADAPVYGIVRFIHRIAGIKTKDTDANIASLNHYQTAKYQSGPN